MPFSLGLAGEAEGAQFNDAQGRMVWRFRAFVTWPKWKQSVRYLIGHVDFLRNRTITETNWSNAKARVQFDRIGPVALAGLRIGLCELASLPHLSHASPAQAPALTGTAGWSWCLPEVGRLDPGPRVRSELLSLSFPAIC